MPMGFGIFAVVDITAAQKPVVLAMGDDQLAQILCRFHGFQHARIGLHAAAVVGEARDIGGHCLHIGKLLPCPVHRDGAVGDHADSGVAPNDGKLLLQMRKAVGCGIQIRHSANGGIAAPRPRQRAGGNGLLIRKPRLTQMYMYICETGKQ